MVSLQQTLLSNGYSTTAPRILVFGTLQKYGPLTMPELIKRTADSLNRASVYRTVALFEKLGIIQRLQIGWKYRLELSNNFQPHHHHMFCVSCNVAVEVAEDKTLEAKLREIAESQNFLAQDHQIEIRGLCSVCRLNQNEVLKS
jgi:Fe2+ or Zn2+ uptake regulation protein